MNMNEDKKEIINDLLETNRNENKKSEIIEKVINDNENQNIS